MSKSVKQASRVMSAPVSAKMLKADLETYQQKALEFGATDARVIPAGWAQVDERVRLKCAIPPCPNYNRCANCPPYTPEPEFVRKALARYGWAILFKHDVIPVEDFADVERYYPMGKIISGRPMRLPPGLKARPLLTAIASPWDWVPAVVVIRYATADCARCWTADAARTY